MSEEKMSIPDSLELALKLLKLSRNELLYKIGRLPVEQHRIAVALAWAYFCKCAEELSDVLPTQYRDPEFRRHAFDLLRHPILDLFA